MTHEDIGKFIATNKSISLWHIEWCINEFGHNPTNKTFKIFVDKNREAIEKEIEYIRKTNETKD